jgi:hypothetical protein
MCKAFSCIVDQVGKVTWKFGVDSHSELARLGGYKDEVLGEFSKIEITPKNNDYLNPDEWVYRVDESPVPNWCGNDEKELALKAHKKWLKALDKFLVRKKIVHPFKIVPPEIGPKQIKLLKKWASVRDSVWDSVGDSVRTSVGDPVGASVRASVWASVGYSVRTSVGDSVGTSVWASVWDSVWASVWAYTGSFFKIPVWKYVKHTKGRYPYQPLVTLWNQGLVPSFDGTTWRLHGGPKATVLFSITKVELEKHK